jgi:hypothetical protein
MAEKINFLGGLVPSYQQEFEERKKYKDLIDDPRLIDIWYENHGYGFVNSKFETMILAESPDIIKSFDGFADSIGAVNFVTDAFVAFRDDYINKVNNSTIGYPPFLDNLVPVAGYQSFEELFGNWSAYSATKYSSALQDNKNIHNYDSYLEEIKKVFLEQLGRFPVTKSGFSVSKHNNIGTSGLSIELADLDYDIDLQKGEIIQSFDFRCYVDLANAYGFYVDKNAPWRLLCNLEHPTTRIFIRSLDLGGMGLEGDENHKHLTTEQIFDNIYRVKTNFDDLFVLQDFIVKVYNQIKKDVPFYEEIVYNSQKNKIETKSVFRKEINFLSTHQWIDLLVMVRLLEIGQYTEQKYNEICSSALKMFDLFGLRRAQALIGTEMSNLMKNRLMAGGNEKRKTFYTNNQNSTSTRYRK